MKQKTKNIILSIFILSSVFILLPNYLLGGEDWLLRAFISLIALLGFTSLIAGMLFLNSWVLGILRQYIKDKGE